MTTEDLRQSIDLRGWVAPVAVAVGGSLLVAGMVAFAVGRPAIRRLA